MYFQSFCCSYCCRYYRYQYSCSSTDTDSPFLAPIQLIPITGIGISLFLTVFRSPSLQGAVNKFLRTPWMTKASKPVHLTPCTSQVLGIIILRRRDKKINTDYHCSLLDIVVDKVLTWAFCSCSRDLICFAKLPTSAFIYSFSCICIITLFGTLLALFISKDGEVLCTPWYFK